MDTVLGLAVIALIKKVMDFVIGVLNFNNPDEVLRKTARNRVYFQLVVWLVSVFVVLGVSVTLLKNGQDVFGFGLSDYGFWGQVIIGLIFGSTASLSVDTLNALDPTKQTVSLSAFYNPPRPGVVAETEDPNAPPK